MDVRLKDIFSTVRKARANLYNGYTNAVDVYNHPGEGFTKEDGYIQLGRTAAYKEAYNMVNELYVLVRRYEKESAKIEVQEHDLE